MALAPLIQTIVDWLRRGYPNGVPRQDYVPLLALLGRHLSAEETADVVGALLADHPDGEPTSPDAVRAAIEAVTRTPALESDVTRVGTYLESVRTTEAELGS